MKGFIIIKYYNMPNTILIIDDSPVIIDLLSLLLCEVDVLTAGDEGEAMSLIRKYDIDLIICDAAMSDIDGFRLSRLVKSDLRTSHIPVVLLTAKNILPAKTEGPGAGADRYIEKPLNPHFVAVQVKSLLQEQNIHNGHW